MSVAGLLGLLGNDYKEFECINPNNIIYYGIRSIDEGEHKLLKDNNIKNFNINYIKENKNHLNELNNLIRNKNIHVSFDVDSMDESIISSTGTVVQNGLKMNEIIALFQMLSKYNIKSIDIVEFNRFIGNPYRSTNNLKKIIYELLI